MSATDKASSRNQSNVGWQSDMDKAPRDGTLLDLRMDGDGAPDYVRMNLRWGEPWPGEEGWLNGKMEWALEEGEVPIAWRFPPDAASAASTSSGEAD